MDFFGSIYSGELNNFIDWSVYIYGAYSNNELQLLRISPTHYVPSMDMLRSTMWSECGAAYAFHVEMLG